MCTYERPLAPRRRPAVLLAASALALSLLASCTATGAHHAALGPGVSDAFDLADLRPSRRQDEAAEKPGKKAKPADDGFYLSGFLAQSEVSSKDLDGETIVVGPGGVILLPELDDGTGWGGAMGWRHGTGAFEFSYVRTEHDTTFMGFDGEAAFCTFNLDLRKFFRPESKLQPNLLVGLALPSLIVEDGSSDGFVIEDGEFIGIGFNVGAGLDYYLTPHVALVSQAVYRFADLNSAEGAGVSGSIDGGVDVDGLDLRVGLRLTF